MCYYIVFSPIALALVVIFYLFFDVIAAWPPYLVWMTAMSTTTFIMYGLDKLMSRTKSVRTPEEVLHCLAILGGFPGGWLGMATFQHKINIQEHPDFYAILALSTIGHAAFCCYWISRGH